MAQRFLNAATSKDLFSHLLTVFILFIAVIPDSLRVTSVPQTLNKVERDSLELKCEVSKSTPQHSHLSISWYRQKVGEPPVEVISLSRDFVLRAGSTYAQRQATGDVRLDKVGETTSKLTVYNLQPSDQGEFYCEAAEWIQDPDKSWYAMTRKRSEGTIVNIQATGRYLQGFFSWTGIRRSSGWCNKGESGECVRAPLTRDFSGTEQANG